MYDLFRLNNNLRVAAEKIDHVNSICVGLWIETGSRNEDKDINGISHFIEHMLFKGTKNRTSKELSKAIEDVGGQINAFTSKEATCFYIKVLNTHVELALEVLSDMVFNSLFSEEDIEKEKTVVYEEISMSEDSPEDVLSDIYTYGIYGDDTISLPILGTKETLSKFNRKDLKEYVNKYYTPDNSVLSICGNFDEKDINQIIEKHFGQWESNKSTAVSYSKPEFSGLNVFKEKDIEQIHMALSIKGVGLGSKENYPLSLLCNLLGGGASSILFQKLREEMGLCYSVYAYPSSLINTGIITIYSAVNPSTVHDAYNAINHELSKFIDINLTDKELQIAKEQLKGSYILGMESTSSKMFSNGKSALFFNKINTPNDIIRKIEDISRESLKDVMEKTFSQGVISTAFVGNSIEIVDNICEKKFIKV